MPDELLTSPGLVSSPVTWTLNITCPMNPGSPQ
jgi:hypothetical protein